MLQFMVHILHRINLHLFPKHPHIEPTQDQIYSEHLSIPLPLYFREVQIFLGEDTVLQSTLSDHVDDELQHQSIGTKI